jgi:hypothetical protein
MEMKMKRLNLALAAILALGATAAVAQTMVEDTDGDGVYSMDELKVAFPDLTEEVFVTVDANADGAVDADELAAAEEAGVLVAG